MNILGTIVEVSPSRQEGMSRYRMEYPVVPGGPISASFTAPAGKYKVGDTVYDDDTAPKIHVGTWSRTGKGVCF